MNNFKIAVAQIPSEKGNMSKNIETHINAVSVAWKNSVSMIVFPELSLTGYEPELAASMALTVDDERLYTLSSEAVEKRMWLIAGAPLRSENGVEIGAFIFSPEGSISTYSKMNLHPGEDEYFKEGNTPKIIEIQNHKIAISICADANNPNHARAYAQKGATIYLAGVLITEGGYGPDTANLASYARQHDMLVAMANHNYPTGGWNPIGKSAVWSKDGILSVASETKNALVISQESNDSWVAEVIEM